MRCTFLELIIASALAVLLSCRADAQNLLTNPGMESGRNPWFAIGAGGFGTSAAAARTGQQGALISSRTAPWNGVGVDVRPLLVSGGRYVASAHIRPTTAGDHIAILTLKVRDAAGEHYTGLNYRTVPGNEWTQLVGAFTFTPTGTVLEATLYIEGPAAGVSFWFDDATLQRQDDGWKAAANQRIQQLRTRPWLVSVVDSAGAPVVNATVRAKQISHDFAFGTAITDSQLNNPRYTNFLKANFEWGVPEYECKWHYIQPSSTVRSMASCDRIAAFGRANGLKMRGHNIFWEVSEFCPRWLDPLTAPALQAAMSSHLTSIVGRYAQDFVHWDVNNEMLHGNYFSARLGTSIWTWMYQQARMADPDCRLFVNDYNNIDGTQTPEFRRQISQLLAAGAPIDGVGVQAHFGNTVDALAVKLHLDSLAELGLPIWLTEFDALAPDPAQRAEVLEAVYRMSYSHPEVEGILMWGFWAGAHWRGADGALIDLDWTINAAGQRYLSLLQEWTTVVTVGVTPAGDYRFTGFHGEYELTATTANGRPASAVAHLGAGAGPGVVTIVLATPCIADFDNNGGVDGGDIEMFFSAWEQGAESADVNADGGIDGLDIGTFFERWEAGAC